METKRENSKTAKAPEPTSQVATIDKTLADSVLNKVKLFTANKDLRLPPDYSPENALKAAWLILLETKDSKGQMVLSVCTRESIANSLLKMVILGLNPLKKQCDFIAYGDKLTCNESYFGDISLAKRHGGVFDVIPTVIFEGDTFEYEIKDGHKRITKHIQSIDNIDINKIKGAYATVYFEDKDHTPYIEIMTIIQIRQAWLQGAAKGNSTAHKNFTEEMSAKTVIARACKRFKNTSDDSDLGFENTTDERAVASKQAIADNANKEEITMDVKAEVVEEKKETPPTTTQSQNTEVVPNVNAEPSKLPGF
jgi:recombination protein RecT